MAQRASFRNQSRSDLPISVLLPVSNGARYLAATLDSLLAQTLQDLEIVAVDDGSTDETRNILDAYSARDQRLRIISQPRSGLVSALNRGLAECRGTYVARMDADDISLPHRLEKQVACLKAHPDMVAVGCQTQIIDASGHTLRRGFYPIGQENCRRYLVTRASPLCHPAVTFRVDAVRAVGGYRQAYQNAEDYDLWLRLGGSGEIDNLPDVLLKYRLHGENVSARQSDQQAVMTALALVAASARARGEKDPTPPEGWPHVNWPEVESLLPDNRSRIQFRHVYFRILVLNGAITDPRVFDRLRSALPQLVADASDHDDERSSLTFTLVRAALQMGRCGRWRVAGGIMLKSGWEAPFDTAHEVSHLVLRGAKSVVRGFWGS